MNHRSKTGLFFGSFDPVHIGHLIIAENIYNQTVLEKIWFVISPQNPHKTHLELTNTADRLQMLKIAIEDNPMFEVCDVELGLSPPNYTIDTLTLLEKTYSQKEFVLIIGSDNILSFERWKHYEKILEKVEVYVYPRGEFKDHKLFSHDSVKFIDAPRLDISSTNIRDAIAHNRSVRYLLHQGVYDYIYSRDLYRK
jgi:nicotinate-nucleotide adenylyltransferase